MGLPLNMDALALFYNSEMLAQANVEPPQTWTDFVLAVNKLRDVQKGGTAVRRAGAALGTASNVNFATDILYLLMLQNGTKMLSDDKSTATFHLSETGPGGQPRFLGTEALSFYTAFAIPDSSVSTDLGTVEVYNWNQSMPNSLQAFTRRKTAMMFGYASQIETLQKLGLKFGVVPAPQPEPELVDQTVREKAVNYAQYQIITVARKSAHPAAAWALANYLVSAEAQKILNQTTQRLSARRDLREEQMKIRLYGTFVEEFETAQNWYKKDPNKMNKIFETAINAVALFGQSPQNALESAAQSANVILREK
jgi:ABC-type glycerol-3-phosphate transport system substrate-binding protein